MAQVVGDLIAKLRLDDKLSGPLKEIGGGLTGVGIVAGGVTAAFVGLAAAVATVTKVTEELGKRGAAVADVTAHFEALSQAAGETADTMLGALQRGVVGTIKDFDLMAIANKALGTGLIKSSKDIETLAAGARLLAKRTGVDTKQAFESMLQAIASGRTAQLKQIGLFVDSKDAVEKYAKSLGIAEADVNDTQRAAALSQATLEALRNQFKLITSGAADFGEKIEALYVRFSNFWDQLAAGVAASPVLLQLLDDITAGLETIGEAIMSAFGGGQADAIKVIVSWIEEFFKLMVEAVAGITQGLATLAQGFTSASALIVDRILLMVNGLDALNKAWALAPWNREKAAAYQKQLDGIRSGLEGFVKGSQSATDFLQHLADGALDVAKGMEFARKPFKEFGPSMEQLARKTREADAATKKYAEEIGSLADAWRKSSTDTGIAAEEHKKIQGILQGVGSVVHATESDIYRAVEALRKLGDEGVMDAAKLQQAWEKAHGIMILPTPKNIGPLQVPGVGTAGTKQLDALTELYSVVDKGKGLWTEYGDVVSTEIQNSTDSIEKATDATTSWSQMLQDMQNVFQILGVTADSALGQMVTGLLAGLSAMEQLQKAAVNGEVTMAQFATSVAQVGAQAYQSGSALGGLAQGAAFGASFGPIGAAVGGVVGGILGLFGGHKKKEEELKKQREQALKEATAQLEQLSQKVDDIKFEALQTGLTGVTALFTHLGDVTDATQERFDRLGSIGYAMFETLKKQGYTTVQAMEAMGDAIDAAIKAAQDQGKEFSGAFAELAAFRQKVLDNKDLVNAAEGMGQVFDALMTNGMLTADTFAQGEAEIGDLFKELTDQGFTAEQSLSLMAPALYDAQQAAQKMGFTLDANTQALVDQADAAHLFDNLASPFDAMTEALQNMAQILANLTITMGGTLPESVQQYLDKLNEVPGTMDTTVTAVQDKAGKMRDAVIQAGMQGADGFINGLGGINPGTIDIMDENGKILTDFGDQMGDVGAYIESTWIGNMGEFPGALTSMQPDFETAFGGIADVGVAAGHQIAGAFGGVLDKLNQIPDAVGTANGAFGNLKHPDMGGGGGPGMGYQHGTPGLDFVNFGAGTSVTLHGMEAVVPAGHEGAFAAAHGVGGGGVDPAIIDALVKKLDSTMLHLPRTMARAVRDANQMGV